MRADLLFTRVALGGLGGAVVLGLGLAACGGDNKPPLTPDQIEGEEAGAAAAAPVPTGSSAPALGK